jgi:GTP cyclohydrolase II
MNRPENQPIYQIDRAIGQIRRGGSVLFDTPNGEQFLFCAAEFFGKLHDDYTADQSFFLLPGSRYRFLENGSTETLTGDDESGTKVSNCRDLHRTAAVLTADESGSLQAIGVFQSFDPTYSSILRLLKWSYTLPVAVVRPRTMDEDVDQLPRISAASMASYLRDLPGSIKLTSKALLPIDATQNAEILAFGSDHSSQEHFVLRIGTSLPNETAPLVRIHSECFTGDLLGSLRCDCGSQLRQAINLCTEAGSGLILYLHQEGRGIGLSNKVRAYALQDKGLDTVEANTVLGFNPDERDFSVASAILRLLAVEKLRLITNNPYKSDSLEKHGFKIEGLVPLRIDSNQHSKSYLDTKVEKMGHKL